MTGITINDTPVRKAGRKKTTGKFATRKEFLDDLWHRHLCDNATPNRLSELVGVHAVVVSRIIVAGEGAPFPGMPPRRNQLKTAYDWKEQVWPVQGPVRRRLHTMSWYQLVHAACQSMQALEQIQLNFKHIADHCKQPRFGRVARPVSSHQGSVAKPGFLDPESWQWMEGRRVYAINELSAEDLCKVIAQCNDAIRTIRSQFEAARQLLQSFSLGRAPVAQECAA